MLKRMVLASNCISAALRSTISAELESGDLVALPIKSPSIRTHAGIVTLLDRTVSPAVEAFISQLLKAAGKNDDYSPLRPRGFAIRESGLNGLPSSMPSDARNAMYGLS